MRGQIISENIGLLSNSLYNARFIFLDPQMRRLNCMIVSLKDAEALDIALLFNHPIPTRILPVIQYYKSFGIKQILNICPPHFGIYLQGTDFTRCALYSFI